MPTVLSYPERAGPGSVSEGKGGARTPGGSLGQPGVRGIASPDFKGAPGLLKPTPMHTEGLAKSPGGDGNPRPWAHTLPRRPGLETVRPAPAGATGRECPWVL